MINLGRYKRPLLYEKPMQWKTKRKLKLGDTRRRHVFAWLPTELNDGTSVWLENYMLVEVWFLHETAHEALDYEFWSVANRLPIDN